MKLHSLEWNAQFIPDVIHNPESISYRVYKLSVLKRVLHARDGKSEMAGTLSRYHLHDSIISRVYFLYLVTLYISQNMRQEYGFE